MNTQDKRVIKTKATLTSTLIRLLQSQSLQNITVLDLVKEAGVNKATFYLHFKDINGLYASIEDSFIESLDTLVPVQVTDSYSEVFRELTSYIDLNKDTARALLSLGYNDFHTRLNDFLVKRYFSIWQAETGQTLFSEKDVFIATYHIQGCIAIIHHWLNSPLPCTKEDLAELIDSLNSNLENL